jgi:hypothetical protein
MLHNLSRWQATTAQNWLANKQKCTSLVVKQSFDFDMQGKVFACQSSAQIRLADEITGHVSTSALIACNEVMPFKEGFEFYAQATAYPPKDKQVRVVEVNISLLSQRQTLLSKTLRIMGKRVWRRSLLGTIASDPQILSATKISYEHAYGGMQTTQSKQVKTTNIHQHNPAGRGYGVKWKNLKGAVLASIEYPEQTLKSPDKSIAVAGYGPIPPYWLPRLALLPQIEQSALASDQFPYKTPLPVTHFNYAPHDQQLKQTLQPGWQLSLKGLFPGQVYNKLTLLAIPYHKPLAAINAGHNQRRLNMVCDTLVLSAETQQFHLIWRTSIANSQLGKNTAFIVQ